MKLLAVPALHKFWVKFLLGCIADLVMSGKTPSWER